MIISIDGVDGTGKTSLVKFLSKRYGFRIVKFSKPKRPPYIEYISELLNSTEPTVWDRSYLGEPCYGMVWRGVNDLEADWKWRNLESLMRMRCSYNVYCESEAKTIENVFKTRGEEFTQVHEILPLMEKFEESLKRSTLKWERFEWKYDKDYSSIVKKLDAWYEEYQKYAPLIKRLVHNRTRGNFYASTLVMGEIANGDKERPEFQDYVVPFGNGLSAELLFSVIDDSVALSNVKKYHLNGDIGDISAELSLPNLKKVVCLGQTAEDLLVETGLWKGEIERVVHPSYALRKHWTKDRYSDLLRRSL